MEAHRNHNLIYLSRQLQSMNNEMRFKSCPNCNYELRLHHRAGLEEKGAEFNAELVCKNPRCEFSTCHIREFFEYG
jgi:hypothetical protein